MSAHDDAVEAAGRYVLLHSPMSWIDARVFGEAVVDAVEPIIRADERVLLRAVAIARIKAEVRERLRAQVEALSVYLVDDQSEPGGPSIIHRAVSLESVLALLGGESNG